MRDLEFHYLNDYIRMYLQCDLTKKKKLNNNE